jgi:glycosyltransferase involved in cell wall biosynthesis
MRERSSLRIKLKIVGNGPLMAHLRDMAVEKGLRVSLEPHECADVSFTGAVANVFDHLATADVFLFPSRYEGMPNALMEAMYAEVPTIAADCPTGPRELLGSPEPGGKPAGILVPVPDASSTADLERWAQAICWLHSNEKSRSELVSLARQRLQEFVPNKIYAKWLSAIADEPSANSLIDERFGTDSACVG